MALHNFTSAMRLLPKIIPVVALAAMICGCSSTPPAKKPGHIQVVAPDYLRGILDRAAQQFQDENGGTVKITYTKPDSVTDVAKRVPDNDLFFDGYPKRFKILKNDTALTSGTYSCPFRLSMVLVGRVDGPHAEKLDDLKREEFRRIVILNPAHEYEGKLAARILNRHHLWDNLIRKMILAESQNQLLSYLNSKEADAAIIFESTMQTGQGITILKRLDDELDDRLVICGAVMPFSKNKEVAQAFLDLLDSSLCLIYKIDGIYQYDGKK